MREVQPAVSTLNGSIPEKRRRYALSVQQRCCNGAKYSSGYYAEPKDSDMPSLSDNAQQKERYRALGSCYSHDADALAYGFPHDGFGVVKLKTNNISCLFANTVGDADRDTGDISYERSLSKSAKASYSNLQNFTR